MLSEYLYNDNCPKVKTIDQVFNYKIPDDKIEYCDIYKNTLKTKYLRDKDIVIGDLRILLFKDSATNMTIAMVFYKTNFAGTIFNNDEQLFTTLLKTIKTNTSIKSIDEYLIEGNKNIELGKEHLAVKNLISAIMLKPNHKDIKPLYQKIYNYKKASVEIIWKITKFLENDLNNVDK
ncbi:MAG: hypothetical protein LBD84_03610 [Campylobacteraceae bacterium]|jgi:hypothetical protein|nr:hypothetical protein [Campylobacteraceae bacterium]